MSHVQSQLQPPRHLDHYHLPLQVSSAKNHHCSHELSRQWQHNGSSTDGRPAQSIQGESDYRGRVPAEASRDP